jgi:transcriptional regulator with XRE-family HTH domain
MVPDDYWQIQLEALGNYIRTQRRLANLSLRELSERTNISNPYLSQIERGQHVPSVRVLRALALALNISAESLLAEAGLIEGGRETGTDGPSTEAAIRSDPRLTDGQKQALLSVYHSYISQPGKESSGS